MMQRSFRAGGLSVALGWLILSSGCGRSSPQFQPNMEGRNPANVPFEQKQLLVNVMSEVFGTPDEPYVMPQAGLDLKKLQLAAGPTWSDEEGEHRGLFRRHCAHCHGITGDGAGPTALFLNPYPRDFRRGIFKFKSTERTARPTTADLKRTLREGIPGTAMPSFALLPEDEVDALVEYVRYLSIRGQLEEDLLLDFDADDEIPTDRETILGKLTVFARPWNEAESKVIKPDLSELPPSDTAELLEASIARGRTLYHDTKYAQCFQCHGPTGLGDGGGTGPDYQPYDDWNKLKTNPEGLYFALPIQQGRPRNLHLGIYRGGRRPLDLYRRIYAGINGTPMPELRVSLKPNQIWDLVNYVRSLPYEGPQPAAQQQAALGRARL